MKRFTSVLAGAAFIMAAAGLAVSVYQYLSDKREWEMFEDECDCDDDECCCDECTDEPAEEKAEEKTEEKTEEE